MHAHDRDVADPQLKTMTPRREAMPTSYLQSRSRSTEHLPRPATETGATEVDERGPLHHP